jgi:hypothetical protein
MSRAQQREVSQRSQGTFYDAQHLKHTLSRNGGRRTMCRPWPFASLPIAMKLSF